MARQLESDKVLFAVIVVLVLFGAVMVFSASAVLASERYGSSYYFVLRQVLWAGLGLGLMVAMMNVDYRKLANPPVIFTALAVQLIMLVAVLFADRSHNAHRWFHLGPATFQPAEFSKIVLVLFMAYFLELRRNALNDWKKRCNLPNKCGRIKSFPIMESTSSLRSPSAIHNHFRNHIRRS